MCDLGVRPWSIFVNLKLRRCRVEVLAALCPKRTLTGKWRRGPMNVRYRFHHDANDPGMGPLLKDSPLFNPMEGLFTSETDRPIVIQITKRIAQRFGEYVASRSIAWNETLDMDTLPDWLVAVGQKGAEARVFQRSMSMNLFNNRNMRIKTPLDAVADAADATNGSCDGDALDEHKISQPSSALPLDVCGSSSDYDGRGARKSVEIEVIKVEV